jgi:hypothetical protein
MKSFSLKWAAVTALLVWSGSGSQVFSQTSNGGRDAFDFLKVSPVSRAVGVGGAYTALGDDVGSIAYNPAGLASVLTNEVNFTFLSLYQGISYEFIAFAYPMTPSFPDVGGTLALSVDLLQPGNLPRTDDSGVTIGTFSSANNVYTLSYARSFGPSVQAGLSARLIQQQIDTVQSSLVGFDAGIVVLPPFPGMRVGASIKNVGARGDGFDLPFSLNAGISYRHYDLISEQDDGALTAEAVFPLRPIEDKVGMRLGAEYNFKWVGSRATLRAGYKLLDNDLSGIGLTLGAGYGLDLSGAVLLLDYAFAPADIFGSAHRISLTTKF